MDYGEVLSRAWRIIWKHKILWIFGILASCSSGNGSNSNFRGNAGDSGGNMFPEVERFFNQLDPALLTALIIGAVIIALILVVIAVFLGITGQIALYRGAQRADRDLDTHLSFGELFRGSLPYFWRIFLLGLLVFAAILVVVLIFVVLAIPLSIFTLGIGMLCLIPLICLLIPVFIALSVVVEQAQIAIVVEDLGVMDGLRRGWEVVRANAVHYLVMWLILGLAITGIGGFILGLPMLLFAAPMLFSFISERAFEFNAMVITSLVCIVAYLPVLIVLNGALVSYVKSAWTLTFLRLTGRSALAASSAQVFDPASPVPPVPPVDPTPPSDFLPA